MIAEVIMEMIIPKLMASIIENGVTPGNMPVSYTHLDVYKRQMLGSSMKIQVAAADVALGRIDFEYMVE